MLQSLATHATHAPVSLLANPRFREQLATNPIGALSLHGIELDQSALPMHVTLPTLSENERNCSGDPNFWAGFFV